MYAAIKQKMILLGAFGTEMGQNKVGRDGIGQDGTGWDGTGRDGTGRDGTGQVVLYCVWKA